jgi:hypothetical protein
MCGTAAKQYFVPAAAMLTQLMGIAEFEYEQLSCKRAYTASRGEIL